MGLRKLLHAEKQLQAEIDHRKAELDLRREEMQRRLDVESNKPVWNTAPGLAVIGGFITILTALLTNFIQGCSSDEQRRDEHQTQLVMERQKLQSQLIQKAIEQADDNQAAAVNLNFLWEAGLIPDYDKVPTIVADSGALKGAENALPSSKTFGPAVTGVVGRDDRRRIVDTKSPPYASICQLVITRRDDGKSVATGVLVGTRLVLTAGHTLYDHDRGGFVKSVNVSPGQDGSEPPVDELVSKRVVVADGWVNDRKLDEDFGAIILPRPVEGVAPLGFENLPDDDLLNAEVSVIGYPGDKPFGTMWRCEGAIEMVSPTTFGYRMDTSGGMSGAPIIGQVNSAAFRVIGIHAGSGYTTGKFAIRLSSNRIETIRKWIAQADEND